MTISSAAVFLVYIYRISKNVPSSTGYNFNTHPPIFTIFGTCHHQTFKNRLQLVSATSLLLTLFCSEAAVTEITGDT